MLTEIHNFSLPYGKNYIKFCYCFLHKLWDQYFAQARPTLTNHLSSNATILPYLWRQTPSCTTRQSPSSAHPPPAPQTC